MEKLQDEAERLRDESERLREEFDVHTQQLKEQFNFEKQVSVTHNAFTTKIKLGKYIDK